jgi:hypothetical protein
MSNLSHRPYTPSSGYVRRTGDGQPWHVAISQRAPSVCGLLPASEVWGWSQWTTQPPAGLHMCPTCLERDPRRHGAEKREAVR